MELLCLDRLPHIGLQLDTIKVWPRSSFPRMASSRALAHANLYVILLVSKVRTYWSFLVRAGTLRHESTETPIR